MSYPLSGDTPEAPVLIAGAGPVGMTAALALNARGVDATILEAEPEDRDRSGSPQVAPLSSVAVGAR